MSSACPRFSFSVRLQPKAGCDDRSRRALSEAFLSFASEHGLEAGSRSSDTLDFVVTGLAMQASDADRVAAERWLRERSDLAGWTIGELRDLQEE